MSDANSPIIDFYPEKFDTDLNGKKQEWEAVVLIPFINEVNIHIDCNRLCERAMFVVGTITRRDRDTRESIE